MFGHVHILKRIALTSVCVNLRIYNRCFRFINVVMDMRDKGILVECVPFPNAAHKNNQIVILFGNIKLY